MRTRACSYKTRPLVTVWRRSWWFLLKANHYEGETVEKRTKEVVVGLMKVELDK